MARKVKGITLVELLVTIVIVAILAAISFPSLEKSIQRRELKQGEGALWTILNGMRAWDLEHPKELEPAGTPPRNAQFWIDNWKIKLAEKYLTKLKDETENDPRVMTINLGSSVRKMEYLLWSANPNLNALQIFGIYSVNGQEKGRVVLDYNGNISYDLTTACGNNIVDQGEQCDGTAGSCPGGSVCSGTCVCPNLCGNGALDSGESCDTAGIACGNPGDICNSSCQCVGPTCGDGTMQGSEECEFASQCDQSAGAQLCILCHCQPVTGGLPYCGDGILGSGELCDPGFAPIVPQVGCLGGVCSNNCLSCCGDNIKQGSETCDGSDGCSGLAGSTCNSTCSACNCPSGQSENPVGSGHCCPNGTAWNGVACVACGNGVWEQPGEVCDPTVPSSCSFGQICNTTCTLCTCPAGTTLSNYHCCPIGTVWNGHACSACGDGVKSAGEDCDPTDPDPTDQTCTPIGGGSCTPTAVPADPIQAVNFLNALSSNDSIQEILSQQSSYYGPSGVGNTTTGSESFQTDKASCGSPQPRYCQECHCVPGGGGVCGNGLLETGEECDDGNTNSGDGCNTICDQEFCGDNIIQPGLGEACDDNLFPSPSCTSPVHGCMGCECRCVPFLCSVGTIPNLTNCTCDPMPCTQSSDCNDSNDCTNDTCDTNLNHCVYDAASANGNSCDDTDACTTGDQCNNGFCEGTLVAANFCDDGNGCTTDSCDSSTGCVNQNVSNGTSCNDGDACTQTDTCQNGSCTGSNPVTCTASDQCHIAGVCDPGTGVCSNPAKPNGTACSTGPGPVGGDTECWHDECQTGTCTRVFQPYDDTGSPWVITVCDDDDNPATNPPNGCVWRYCNGIGRCSLGGQSCSAGTGTCTSCISGSSMPAGCSPNICLASPSGTGGSSCCL